MLYVRIMNLALTYLDGFEPLYTSGAVEYQTRKVLWGVGGYFESLGVLSDGIADDARADVPRFGANLYRKESQKDTSIAFGRALTFRPKIENRRTG